MSREIRDSIRELGTRGKLELSRQLGRSYLFPLDYSERFIEVAWFGNTISIYDKGYGVGKGKIRYKIHLDAKGVHGTDICRMLGISWDGDSAPRRLWRLLKKNKRAPVIYCCRKNNGPA